MVGPVNAVNGGATSFDAAIAALALLHAAYEMPSYLAIKSSKPVGPSGYFGVGVGVGVGVGIGVGVAVGVGSGVGVEVGVGVAMGKGFLIKTPLFQASLVPDFMQVNFLPDAVAVDPAFAHLAPALGVAACTGAIRVMSKNATRVRNVHLFTTLTTYFLICEAI